MYGNQYFDDPHAYSLPHAFVPEATYIDEPYGSYTSLAGIQLAPPRHQGAASNVGSMMTPTPAYSQGMYSGADTAVGYGSQAGGYQQQPQTNVQQRNAGNGQQQQQQPRKKPLLCGNLGQGCCQQ
uniref:Uncharacterized protein n=1 Tax=Chromera velia CCMP2878 TaxID=1169474 RepID=A0A0G4HBM7_9ALVE|mmetsp:Transcript_36662/g.72101  ORF Transcript_36662/g.72101 Transcript_36662/m.72101 type:complete len:125 (-) Transcript_36662:563-937(-)|eukprot:Cvel_25861.t1-p1 / transcript=Cvel_25861.t1 / gene=Cvel_25861 / organism=Chromera_velia_CCMP2878 / gene_product=hypothetical protein / transcript_product=hypothetical protein / location=Cvel_scaffold2982:11744-12432(-) / protein_length=124 / sequence_SO=supercontig / SO=protein_coding / is_pseudo=false